jgi:hypothetical protein
MKPLRNCPLPKRNKNNIPRPLRRAGGRSTARLPVKSLFFALIVSVSPAIHSQSAGVFLEQEIQNLEKTIGNAQKQGNARDGEAVWDASKRLGALYELSGNIESAAKAWAGAASASASMGKTDDDSLANSAVCFAALGEWEKAAAAARQVIEGGRPGPALPKARYISAHIDALSSSDTTALRLLLDDAGFIQWRSPLYYTLWKVTGIETWKNRLLAEYPQSPEARAAAGSKAPDARVSLKPTAFWLLLPGRTGFSLGQPVNLTGAGTPSAVTPAAAPSAMLQTGLYGVEDNAKAMAGRLRAAGFAPVILKRAVNGKDYFAVQVPPGRDINGTILRLKDSGFESFPVD